MLQTLNIPGSPLPDVPSAAPGSTGPSGDAGERAEFAQLLQQAQGSDAADPGTDAPNVPPAKDARAEPRSRPSAARPAHEHKPHDVRRAARDAEPQDVEVADLMDRLELQAPAEATAADTDEASVASAPKALSSDAAPPTTDPAPPLPAPVGERQQSHAMQLPSQATAVDVPDLGARVPPRTSARDMRLPVRADAAAAPVDGTMERRVPTADPTAAGGGKDGAFELALRQSAGGRGAGAPLFDRTPLETTPAAAHGAALARELHLPLTPRTEAPLEAALRHAPDDARFGPALGAQVALWVKEGVQEARLQLHPAELGPVTVQIALEGQAAHIDFTAAVAATRESIEQSLPALAAALRESGFTLAGGGVFGRSGQGANDSGRERAPEGRGSRGTTAVEGSDSTEVTAATPRRWARSLVDVYA
ncbi:MAG: flagellar hook-length control protein FliK [Burkholderiaceae bacterium]|nr:flagellar hook-length control protein FliK [Burkholderiaceae bacterium]